MSRDWAALAAQRGPDPITLAIVESRRRLRPIGITEGAFKALMRQTSHTDWQSTLDERSRLDQRAVG